MAKKYKEASNTTSGIHIRNSTPIPKIANQNNSRSDKQFNGGSNLKSASLTRGNYLPLRKMTFRIIPTACIKHFLKPSVKPKIIYSSQSLENFIESELAEASKTIYRYHRNRRVLEKRSELRHGKISQANTQSSHQQTIETGIGEKLINKHQKSVTVETQTELSGKMSQCTISIQTQTDWEINTSDELLYNAQLESSTNSLEKHNNDNTDHEAPSPFQKSLALLSYKRAAYEEEMAPLPSFSACPTASDFIPQIKSSEVTSYPESPRSNFGNVPNIYYPRVGSKAADNNPPLVIEVPSPTHCLIEKKKSIKSTNNNTLPLVNPAIIEGHPQRNFKGCSMYHNSSGSLPPPPPLKVPNAIPGCNNSMDGSSHSHATRDNASEIETESEIIWEFDFSENCSIYDSDPFAFADATWRLSMTKYMQNSLVRYGVMLNMISCPRDPSTHDFIDMYVKCEFKLNSLVRPPYILKSEEPYKFCADGKYNRFGFNNFIGSGIVKFIHFNKLHFTILIQKMAC
jgi:hypothetical protein